MFKETPDLSKEFHPVPKPLKKEKSGNPGIKKYATIKPGKKTNDWTDARQVIKQQFKVWGIMTCEVKLHPCWKKNALGFAHIDKRQNLHLPEDLYKVVLSCNPCHEIIEKWPRLKMRRFLLNIIANREYLQNT